MDSLLSDRNHSICFYCTGPNPLLSLSLLSLMDLRMHEICVSVAHMIQDQKEPTSYGDQTFHESSLAQKGCSSSLLFTF